jgi:ubiquinone/menaquinone biosynthesis C-methylase UbiE
MPRWKRLRLAACLAASLATPFTARAQNEFEADASRLVTALGLRAGQTVADIGAGRGQLVVALAREVGPSGQVYATEMEEGLRRDIREAAESAGLTNVTVLEAHSSRTNLPERCCDVLVMRRVYHHIGDPRRMNASMHQSLRPGGHLAIIDFPPDSAESADPNGRAVGDRHGVTSTTVVRELKEAGFEVVNVEEGGGRDRYMVVVRRPPA